MASIRDDRSNRTRDHKDDGLSRKRKKEKKDKKEKKSKRSKLPRDLRITEEDSQKKAPLFQKWLQEERRIDSTLSSVEERKMFRKFVKKWNHDALPGKPSLIHACSSS